VIPFVAKLTVRIVLDDGNAVLVGKKNEFFAAL
jgi:hypothetical protein